LVVSYQLARKSVRFNLIAHLLHGGSKGFDLLLHLRNLACLLFCFAVRF